ncbi:hypothetical protein WME76_17915 [Sorangium sp. So ce119]|uniref:hypothetical protein n=1 Tax=Sorangium sp. So ce119 TaxID=3133279 RepID=UPI003F6131C9
MAYRASPEPQELSVDVTVAGVPETQLAHFMMRTLLDAINGGAAGGSLFHPAAGSAALLRGPLDEAPTGSSYAWVVRVAAVAPVFLRTCVDQLALCGAGKPVTSLTFRGSVPLDGSPLSITDRQVRAMLTDPTAYVDAWPAPGFPVRDGDRGADDVEATLRLEMGSRITSPVRARLEDLAIGWINVVHRYADNHGRYVTFNPQKTLPRFGQSKTEFRAYYPEFRWASGPARAAMINMLTRFHHEVAPIAAAEIGA